jgi:16S rRNA processing protein RimM
MGSERRVLMGRVLGAHGIRGAVRVLSYAAAPEDIARYGPLEDESGGRKLSLTVVGKARGAVLAEVEGIADRDAAEALKGTKLYVQRSALPAPEAGEFYWDDLVGLRAEMVGGRVLGEVVAVHDYGGGPSLEVKRQAGAPVMVPFTNRVVPVVDLVAGKLVIDPPAGLFETPPTESAGDKDEE